MRRDDEFDVGIVVYQADQQLFVGTPRRAGHEDPLAALEPLDHVDMLGGLGDLGDTVEARVARYDHVVEAQSRQQSFFDSSFCTNITSNDSSACRHMPP